MNPSRFKQIILFCSLILAFTPLVGQENSYPGDAWPKSTPEAQGVDPELINKIISELEAGEYGLVDHFLLIRNGKAIVDHKMVHNYDSIVMADGDNHDHAGVTKEAHQYNYDHTKWHPFYNGSALHTLQSVTKSVTSAALGIAIDEGHIKDVQVPVHTFFSNYEYDLSDPRKKEITLEDFLTMRSGIDWVTTGGYSSDEHSTIQLEASETWIQYVLDRPMDQTPGTTFEYNDGVSVLLGKILREATGRRIDDWAREKLFNPIGIKDFHWKITPDDEADTEGGLYLSTHDLARIGYLFLRKGKWNGKQIISEEWVEASTAPVIPDLSPDPNRNLGYGYQWWVPSHGEGQPTIYAGNGYGGQFIMVAPEYDIVAVFNGWSLHSKANRSTFGILQTQIIPSIDGK